MDEVRIRCKYIGNCAIGSSWIGRRRSSLVVGCCCCYCQLSDKMQIIRCLINTANAVAVLSRPSYTTLLSVSVVVRLYFWLLDRMISANANCERGKHATDIHTQNRRQQIRIARKMNKLTTKGHGEPIGISL